MELKIDCDCGQPYKFDVEPVGGRMPVTVNCPSCQADGTSMANARLAEHFQLAPAPKPIAPAAFAPIGSTAPAMAAAPPSAPPSAPPLAPPPPPAPAMGGLRINHAPPAAVNTPPPVPIAAIRPLPTEKKAKVQTGEFSMVRGIIGGVIGSVVGCGLMYAFWIWAEFRFPFMGVAVGAVAGYLARFMARGTENSLGVITAVISAGSVAGTLTVMYGGFPMLSIISVVVCASVAYRLTSE